MFANTEIILKGKTTGVEVDYDPLEGIFSVTGNDGEDIPVTSDIIEQLNFDAEKSRGSYGRY